MGTHAASVALYRTSYKADVDSVDRHGAGAPILILSEGFRAKGSQGVRDLREGQRSQAQHGACGRRSVAHVTGLC
jgi:hypothetical protein